MAITISTEVDLQNGYYIDKLCSGILFKKKIILFIELVDDLLVKMDKTSVGIENETKEVVKILKKDSTRGR